MSYALIKKHVDSCVGSQNTGTRRDDAMTFETILLLKAKGEKAKLKMRFKNHAVRAD